MGGCFWITIHLSKRYLKKNITPCVYHEFTHCVTMIFSVTTLVKIRFNIIRRIKPESFYETGSKAFSHNLNKTKQINYSTKKIQKIYNFVNEE